MSYSSTSMGSGNERGDEPLLNIQGYNLCSPLTDKYMDLNSRFEYAHRVALISDDIYKSGVENCRGDYVNTNTTNSLCLNTNTANSKDGPNDVEGLDASIAHIATLLSTEPSDGMLTLLIIKRNLDRYKWRRRWRCIPFGILSCVVIILIKSFI